MGWLKAVCVVFVAILAGPSVAGQETLKIAGQTAILDSPDRLKNQPAPLVVALHGGLGNGRQLAWSLGLSREAAAQGFRVVYGQGTPAKVNYAPYGRVWNAGSCCGVANRQSVDHVGFLASLIKTLRARGLVSRVVMVGHSNGSMMALRLACDRPELVDDVVAIAGPILVNGCKNMRSVRVLHLHGAKDGLVKVAGGSGGRGLSFPPLARSVATLRKAGAKVEVRILKDAGHLLGGLNRNLRRETGQTLAQMIAARAVSAQ